MLFPFYSFMAEYPFCSDLLAEIEDPPKLSTKLTRALYRKLQQSPCTWVAYTTSRISAARFPDTYNASFQDPIPAENLESKFLFEPF